MNLLKVFQPIHIMFIIIGVIIDLSTKYWVIQNYEYLKSECYLGTFFCMTLTFNTGFVFGIAQNNSILSIFTTIIAIVLIIFYRLKEPKLGNPWGWNLVMVGAFGNLIDKFFIKMPKGGGVKFGFVPLEHGQYIGVVDFLDFDWPNWLFFERWPAFNFADSCVSVGLVILIISIHLQEKEMKKQMVQKEKNS